MNETSVVIVRAVIAFTTLLIYGRLLGKEQIKQLTYFDYITGITIGSIAATLTTNLNNRPWPEFVGLSTWIILSYFLQWMTIRSRRVAKYIDGEPVVVVMNGQLMEDAMHKVRLKLADLLGLLRLKDVFDLTQVEFAVYEKNGNLSVQKKAEFHTVTAGDLNISKKYQGLSTELIYDGVIIEQNLKDMKLDQAWLEQQLRNFGVSGPDEVFLANLNTQGELYIDLYKDRLKQKTNISDYDGPN
ncbi:MAG: DUF421 domain-containing protein [Bacillota bacterium]|nr:DUF421 domain-containing protein [Bacillota bacterium]MDW7682614.1 DUF421 domain-containing protein [Bacillota bacterium]